MKGFSAAENRVACICGRRIRPCNLERHMRTHYPRLEKRDWGHKCQPAKRPIRLGAERDRRYDEHVPRGIGPHRYRIYRLRAGELDMVSTAPEPEHLGVALVINDEEGEWDQVDDSVGVLDTAREPGHWIVNPFTLGRRPEEVAA